MKRDTETGRIIGTPAGEKYPAIIKREQELSIQEGRVVEFVQDYHDLLLSGKMGINEFCDKRLKSGKGWILYGGNSCNGRKSWVEQLGLPRHTKSSTIFSSQWKKKKSAACPICGETEIILDFCHWIAKKDGGLRKYHNGFDGCPNCNRRLDHLVIPRIECGTASDADISFYNRCRQVIQDFIDKEYKNDKEVRELYTRRIEKRSMR